MMVRDSWRKISLIFFERFYKGNGGKNGIGLSIVWTGIHYLGGSITAGNRAVPEHGAYYQLLLPLSF